MEGMGKLNIPDLARLKGVLSDRPNYWDESFLLTAMSLSLFCLRSFLLTVINSF